MEFLIDLFQLTRAAICFALFSKGMVPIACISLKPIGGVLGVSKRLDYLNSLFSFFLPHVFDVDVAQSFVHILLEE